MGTKIEPEPGAVAQDQSAALALLGDPKTHGGRPVERIDTHGAIVFLAGERAYKVKRAVAFPYMDFSTLERRRRACEAEVALNRRTAPELYLGVSAVRRSPAGQLALDGPGEAVEWVVVMRRFDQEELFDRLAERGALDARLMRAVAATTAAFHAGAERLTGAGEHGGGAAGMGWVIEDNVAEFAAWPELFPPAAQERLAAASRAALRRLAPLLDRRLAEGRVRRCHGDLHLRNIFLFEDRPTLFDAIEFNDRLSCIDVLYDFAFLLMDLEHRGLGALANLTFNRYLQEGWDLEGLAVLPLFLSARAAVRAKVGASALPRQRDAGRAERIAAEARAYFAAAERYLAPPPPCLVAVGGLSGTGKTVLARALAPALGGSPGAVHLRSDVLRKQAHGVPESARLPASAYAPEVSAPLYGRMLELAGQGLAAGHAVVVDAVYARPAERAAVAAAARNAGASFLGLWLEAPAETLMRRTGRRAGDASDATPEVVAAQLGYELGEIAWRRIDAGGAPEASLAAARAELRDAVPAALRS